MHLKRFQLQETVWLLDPTMELTIVRYENRVRMRTVAPARPAEFRSEAERIVFKGDSYFQTRNSKTTIIRFFDI